MAKAYSILIGCAHCATRIPLSQAIQVADGWLVWCCSEACVAAYLLRRED